MCFISYVHSKFESSFRCLDKFSIFMLIVCSKIQQQLCMLLSDFIFFSVISSIMQRGVDYVISSSYIKIGFSMVNDSIWMQY